MRVEVVPLYPLNKRLEKGDYEFPEGSTVREALSALGFSPREIREMRVAVGGMVVDLDRELEEGVSIVLIPTLAGG